MYSSVLSQLKANVSEIKSFLKITTKLGTDNAFFIGSGGSPSNYKMYVLSACYEVLLCRDESPKINIDLKHSFHIS